MFRRPFYLVLPVFLASALADAKLRPANTPAAPRAPPPAQAAAVTGAARPSAVGATSARYRLVAEHRAVVADKEAVTVTVTSGWIATDRAGGRTKLELRGARTSRGWERPRRRPPR